MTTHVTLTLLNTEKFENFVLQNNIRVHIHWQTVHQHKCWMKKDSHKIIQVRRETDVCTKAYQYTTSDEVEFLLADLGHIG